MSKTIEFALKFQKNLRREDFMSEPNPENYVKKLGINFEKSHPDVYKAGVLKRA